jgi:peroxiredoxin
MDVLKGWRGAGGREIRWDRQLLNCSTLYFSSAVSREALADTLKTTDVIQIKPVGNKFTGGTMKRNLLYFVGFMLMCGMIFCFGNQGVAEENKMNKSQTDDVQAADFTLRGLNGKDFRLSDYKGKIVLLNFMATWCPDCRASVPYLKKIYAQYNPQGLIMLSIDIEESEDKVLAFSKKYDLPYPILLDRQGTIARSYGVVGVPVKVLIDREGRIICWNCRSLDMQLEKQLEKKTK